MRRWQSEWVMALVAAGLMLLLGAAAAALAGRAARPFSSYDDGPQGLSGIYGVLQARGDAAGRWQGPLRRLPDAADVLVAWVPAVDGEDAWGEFRRRLEEWAAPGRTVVLGGGLPMLEALDAAGVDTADPVQLAAQPAYPAVLDPVTAGVQEVAMGDATTHRGPGGYSRPEVLLVSRGGEPVAVTWVAGRGRIYAFADPHWLTNSRLAKADNLRLALQLLAGRRVIFDEYHHGYRRGSGLGWVLLQLGLAAGAYLLYRGARYAAPAALPPAAPRQAAEYAVAMGNLYRQAGARPAVAAALRRRLEQELRRLGAGARAGPGQWGRFYAARTGRPAAELESLLAALETGAGAAGPRRLTDAELVRLVRQAESVQRRMEHGRDGGTGRRSPGA